MTSRSDGHYYNHAYQDFVMMSILEDEFRQRRAAAGNDAGPELHAKR